MRYLYLIILVFPNQCSLSDLKLKVFELSIHQIAGQKLSRNGIITSNITSNMPQIKGTLSYDMIRLNEKYF